jgi:hypothetical protein
MSNNHGATSLTGGGAGAVDALASAGLTTGDCVYTITSTGLYCHRYDSTSATAESSPDVIAPDDIAGGNGRWLWVAFFGADVLTELLKLYDTDKTHTLSIKWNEDDSGDRVLNLLVAGGDRSLTLNENLTIGDGGNVTITAEDAAGSITLDNASLEVEDTVGSGNTIKFVIGTDDASRTVTLSENLTIGDGNAGTITFTGASKTLSVEDDSVVNQDLTTDASPTFAGLTTLTSPLSVANGGSGAATLADGGLVIGNATGAVEVVAAGATTEVLVGGGATTAPVWTTAQGSGAPVRATSPTLTTPNIGAATAGGQLSMADNILSRPIIKDYAETPQAPSSTATTVLDVEDGNVISFTLTEATTVSTSSILADLAGSLTMVITAAAGSEYAITWPATWKWAGGAAPSTFAVSTEHIVTLMWLDGDATGTFYATYINSYATA